MESLEGKRGNPRIKPPFPAVVGLYGCPTIINNAETLSSVPAIIRMAATPTGPGTPKNGGTRILCVAGHVNKPGIYEIPLGMNMKEFINDIAGGMRGGKKIKAVVPGGSSCPLLKADEIDIAMDYDSVAKAGSCWSPRHGSCLTKTLVWSISPAASCIFTLMSLAGGAFHAAKEQPGEENAGSLPRGVWPGRRH